MDGFNSIDIPLDIRDRERTAQIKNVEVELPGDDNGIASLTDQERQQYIEDKIADRKLRETYAHKAFVFAWVGFGFWVVVIVFYAICFLCGKQVFSDTVLIGVTTATTVNLFAAFVGVIRGLFPPVGKNNKL